MAEICPKCGGIAEYDAYHGRVTCTRCSWESEKRPEGETTQPERQPQVSVKKCEHDIATCGSCFARNYDSKFKSMPGERVKTIYEVRIGSESGSVVVRLCEKCLSALANATKNAIQLPEKEEG